MSLKLDFLKYDALALGKLIAAKEITPLELLDHVIERIESVSELNCICYPNYEAARARAKEKLPLSVFSGLPLFLKDLILFHENTPISSGSKYLKDFIAPYSNEVVKKLLNAGMIFTARTTSAEFGSSPTVESKYWGTTHNPWHRDYSTGGSSGGAAALVASRIFPLTDANDGGGSVRGPAALCGVVGLKPSRGRHSFAPFGNWRFGMAVCGSMSLTVRDAAAYLDLISGNLPGDLHTFEKNPQSFFDALRQKTPKLRIGLMLDKEEGKLKDHPDCRKTAEDIAALCRDLGHDVEDFDSVHDISRIAHYFIASGDVWIALRIAQCSKALGRLPEEEELEASLWAAYQRGQKISAVDHEVILEDARQYAFTLAGCFAPYDVIITPTLSYPGLRLGVLNPDKVPDEKSFQAAFGYLKYITMLNLTGQPGISLPVAQSENGLPIGVQLFGQIGSEEILFKLARDIEEARPWFNRLPPVCAK
jgi:amidase